MRGALRLGPGADRWAAAGMVGLAGVGTVATLAWLAAGQIPWGVSAAMLAAAGLGLLIAAGWLNPLLLVVLATPLPALLSNDGVRVATVAPVAALAGVGWALGKGLSGKAFRFDGLPGWSLASLVAAFVLAAAFSPTVGTAARELLNMSVLLVLLLLVADGVQRDARERERPLTALAAVAGLTGGLAVLETIGIIPSAFPRSGTSFYRAALGFGQPNGLGFFLALAVPLVVYRRSVARGAARIGWTVCLAFTALGLVGTFSRGAWLGLTLGAGALLLVGEWRIVLRIWLVTAVMAVLVDVVSGGALRDTVVRTIGDWVIEQRAALMLAGVLMFLDYPVLGVGPGGFAEQLEQYAPLVPELFDIQPTPHNAFIQMAAEAGVVGLAASLLMTAVVFLTLKRRVLEAPTPQDRQLRLALLWSVGIMAVASQAMWPLAHGTGEAVVLVVGIACARWPREGTTDPSASGIAWPAG